MALCILPEKKTFELKVILLFCRLTVNHPCFSIEFADEGKTWYCPGSGNAPRGQFARHIKARVIIHSLLCSDTRGDAGVARQVVLVAAGEFPKGSVSMRTRSSVIQYLRAGGTGEGGRGSSYEACVRVSVWKHLKGEGERERCNGQATEAFPSNCETQTQTYLNFPLWLKKMPQLLSHAQMGSPALASKVWWCVGMWGSA